MNSLHRYMPILAAHPLSLLNVAEHHTEYLEGLYSWYRCVQTYFSLSILFRFSALRLSCSRGKVNVVAWIFSGWLRNHSATLLDWQKRQSTQPWRGGLQGRSLLKYCNQVSCGGNKALNGMLKREEGTSPALQRHSGQPWDRDRGEKDGEGEFQRCFAKHKLGLVRLSDAQNVHSHRRSLTLLRVCVCTWVTQHIPERKKKKAPNTARKLHILCPLPSALSLSCSMIKVCLGLWGNFAGYI